MERMLHNEELWMNGYSVYQNLPDDRRRVFGYAIERVLKQLREIKSVDALHEKYLESNDWVIELLVAYELPQFVTNLSITEDAAYYIRHQEILGLIQVEVE